MLGLKWKSRVFPCAVFTSSTPSQFFPGMRSYLVSQFKFPSSSQIVQALTSIEKSHLTFLTNIVRHEWGGAFWRQIYMTRWRHWSAMLVRKVQWKLCVTQKFNSPCSSCVSEACPCELCLHTNRYIGKKGTKHINARFVVLCLCPLQVSSFCSQQFAQDGSFEDPVSILWLNGRTRLLVSAFSCEEIFLSKHQTTKEHASLKGMCIGNTWFRFCPNQGGNLVPETDCALCCFSSMKKTPLEFLFSSQFSWCFPKFWVDLSVFAHPWQCLNQVKLKGA